MKFTQDLLRYIESSPSPFHATETTKQYLSKANFTELFEDQPWSIQKGKQYFIRRAESSIIAFKVPVSFDGYHILGAHTDSPCLKLKPKPDFAIMNYDQWGIEIYGGVLYSTWLDRDLSIAGIVYTKSSLQPRLIRINKPICKIPNLAIHLNRNVNIDGLKLNPQTQMNPIIALSKSKSFDIAEFIAKELSTTIEEIAGFEISLFDTQTPSLGGLNDEFIYSARLDNLAMCHAGLEALIGSEPKNKIAILALFNHEEVGSRSTSGAASDFLETTQRRLESIFQLKLEDSFQMKAKSFMISADMAHGVHPNYTDRHDLTNKPILGHGPVIKVNQSQNYATDAYSLSYFSKICDQANIKCQSFVNRADLTCGSTIGPMIATRLGIATVDIGNPMLAMHSIRETAAVQDHEAIISIFENYFSK